MRESVNIFWTGGMDSTYRICELSKLDIDIYPYYLLLPFRQNAEYELRAIRTMSEQIQHRSDTKATLHELQVVEMKRTDTDPQINEAYEWVKEHTIVEFGLKRFPAQYRYLASYCKGRGIQCEIGTEYEPKCRMHQCLNDHAVLQRIDTGGGFVTIS